MSRRCSRGMLRGGRRVGIVRAGLVSLTSTLAACGSGFSAGAGVGSASLEVSGHGSSRVTPVLSFRALVPDSGKTAGGLLSVDVQPLTLHNPLRDETVRPIYVLPQLQLSGGRLCARFGLGPSIHSWGGNNPAAGVEIAPSFGVSLAADVGRVGGARAFVEGLYRTAGSVGEDAVSTSLLGVQFSIGTR